MSRRELATSDEGAAPWRENLRGYRALVGGDQALGWLLVLCPAGWALWLADQKRPSFTLLVAFIAGTILLRSAGFMIDAYFGALLDARAGRIARFPPESERVDPRVAALLCVVLLLVVSSLVLALNPAATWLAASWALLASGYWLVKRHIYLAQAYVGVLASWGVPMAFAALTGAVPTLGWTLFVASVFWLTACAAWQAMAQRDDDLLSGAKSLAILLGEVDLIGQGVLYACMFVALMLVGRDAHLGAWFWGGLLLAMALAGRCLKLARRRDPERCLRASRLNGWIGMAIFIGLVLDFALRATTVNA